MIALISFSNGTSQFYELTHTEKITTVYQVTAPFKNSDLTQVTERTKYFVMRAEHGRTQMQVGLNVTNGALTAGISSPAGCVGW